MTKQKYSSVKQDLARLCCMLYTPCYGNSQLKMEILEFTILKGGGGLFDLIN